MAYMIGANKRRFPRAPLDARAELTQQGKQLQVSVKQIGEGGLCVIAPEELTGAVAVSFELPGFGRQRLFSEVRWVVKPGQSRRAKGGYAVGCRFTRIDAMAQASIARYVGKVKQAYTQLQFALALGKPRAVLVPLLNEAGLSHVVDREELKQHVADVVAQLQSTHR